MMAKGGEGRALLPVSAEAAGKGDGEAAEVFKGSAMTRRGVLAALSYMSCSGTCPSIRASSGRFSVRGCGVERNWLVACAWERVARGLSGLVIWY